MPIKPISKMDQDLHDYLAQLAYECKMQKYNQDTAKVREVEWKKSLFPNIVTDATTLLEQQKSIIATPNQPLLDDVDVVSNTQYDVEKVTTLQNFIKFGLSQKQAEDLLLSLEHRGGDAWKTQGIHRMNGLWAGLKQELSKNFANGASIPLVSSYIIDNFLTKLHPAAKPTRTELLFESLDDPFNDIDEEKLKEYQQSLITKRSFIALQEAAAAHKEEKMEQKRKAALEKGDSRAKKSKFMQSLKVAADEKRAQLAAEEEEALAKMREAYKAREEATPAPITPAVSRKSARKAKKETPEVIPIHQVSQEAEQLINSAKTINGARTVVKNYINSHDVDIIEAGQHTKFFTTSNNPRTAGLKTKEECISFLTEAMTAVKSVTQSAIPLSEDFEEHIIKPSGRGLLQKKFAIDTRALAKNILSVRYNSSRLYKIKPIAISPTTADIISDLVEGKQLDHRLFNRLSDSEQRHIEVYINVMGDAKKHKISNKASHDLFEQFEICKGELAAGNNNPRIKTKLRQLIAEMVDCGFMPHKQAIRILAQLNA